MRNRAAPTSPCSPGSGPAPADKPHFAVDVPTPDHHRTTVPPEAKALVLKPTATTRYRDYVRNDLYEG
ncbi:hypothetical protein ACFYN3_25560 [Streptomyces lavendulae]|uniref:hypothetical protein n=1 Tax=Streptomyces lavendulae TaxID=1914 RepID=UPI00369B71A4